MGKYGAVKSVYGCVYHFYMIFKLAVSLVGFVEMNFIGN